MPYGHPNFGKPLPCSCTLASRRTRSEAQALARLGDELGALADRTFASFDLDRPLKVLYELHGVYYADLARVPMKERADVTIYSEAMQAVALAQARDQAADYTHHWRGWLVLFGNYGAGKSHLAAAIAHVALECGMAVRYRSLPGLFDALKRGFDDGTTDAIFDDLIACDLLILDDLFDSDIRASDWRRSRLFRLLNEREARPTVITSNRRIDDLAPASDVDAGRLFSRIAACAQSIWLPISDIRRLKKERAA